MTFNPKAPSNQYIKIEAEPQPERFRVESHGQDEPIERLRERLASGWVNFLRKQSIKDGGKAANVEFLKANDSFVKWIENVPEEVLRRWNVEREKIFSVSKPTQREVQTSWATAIDEATRVIFLLASNGSQAAANHKVSLDELLASDDYKQLDQATQWAARYAVEHYQKQKSTRDWVLDNHDEQGGLRSDHIQGEPL